MLALAFRAFEFLVFHLLIVVVGRVSRLARASTPPDLMRLYRENLALEAQNGARLLELDAARDERARVPMRVRAAQVFAYLLTRGNQEFHDYYLGASVKTLKRWAAAFRRGPWPWRKARGPGRLPLDEKIVGLILTLRTRCEILGQGDRGARGMTQVEPASTQRAASCCRFDAITTEQEVRQ